MGLSLHSSGTYAIFMLHLHINIGHKCLENGTSDNAHLFIFFFIPLFYLLILFIMSNYVVLHSWSIVVAV